MKKLLSIITLAVTTTSINYSLSHAVWPNLIGTQPSETQRSALPGDHITQNEDEDDDDLLGNREEKKKRKAASTSRATKKHKIEEKQTTIDLLLQVTEDEEETLEIKNNPVSQTTVSQTSAVAQNSSTQETNGSKIPFTRQIRAFQTIDCSTQNLEELSSDIEKLEKLLGISQLTNATIIRELLLPRYRRLINFILDPSKYDSQTLYANCAKTADIVKYIAPKEYKWPIVIDASKKALKILLSEISETPNQQIHDQIKPTCLIF